MVSKRTTIQVSQPCKDALAELGKKGDTFEDIIEKLMIFWKENH